ncbi:MAG: DNA polymerase III subunit chi [Mesorhizobium sp.]
MTDILFYHLTESTLEDALPPLLEKSVERGWRVVVQAGSEERRDTLDTHLWTYRDDSFLGHGLDSDPMAADQPIVLTTGVGNANEASVRFLVDGAEPPALGGYERAVFIFDGHDQAQIEEARNHWKSLRAEGHAVTYWQQVEGRRWERKA